MGFRSGEVVAVQHASGLNAGEGDLDRISVEGISLEEERLTDFPLPSNTLIKWVPGGLIRWAARFVWVRPEVNREKCTACEVCVEICPVQAIHMDGDFPVMDYEKCINCLCCNESCPDGAIYQKQSWIARRVG
jgi:Fe-S-cluster-containing hydrogenase component 2